MDAAHLVLSDVDLSGCLFAGTVHLDQLRLESACTFDTAPPAVHWRRWPPVRFTERRTLAEEHHWRARQPGAVRGWNVAVLGAGRAGPLQLAPVYRALRKALEDGKHEPGAADFYYGEMEMRRHADDIPRSERSLLTAYWALSGYGLRASRALAWLGAAMLLTITLLMAVGLAKDTPKQTATGTVPAGGGTVTFEIDKDDPQNPTGNRFTGERFEKALNITLNSVVSLLRPGPDHHRHLHRDDLTPDRTHPPGPRRSRYPQPRQTLTANDHLPPQPTTSRRTRMITECYLSLRRSFGSVGPTWRSSRS
ncbi:hypothetical protein ACFU53_30030 [Streptomyces sp. NPDC057474]|uniref:hypothetical protein n=1 Tax=Streptomyces sp. NPDC057474 TaxID=3346144 RepID=UPI003683C463